MTEVHVVSSNGYVRAIFSVEEDAIAFIIKHKLKDVTIDKVKVDKERNYPQEGEK